MLNYPYMAIYQQIATGLHLHPHPPPLPPQSSRKSLCIIVCIQNYSLHYPRFIACIKTSNFMHMDTVGLSRGAADCSETNFTIISFGGGERLRVFVYQPSENDGEDVWQSERQSWDESKNFVLLFSCLRGGTCDCCVMFPLEYRPIGGCWGVANRGPCICGTGHTERHFSPEVKLMNHGQVLHSIHIDEEIFLQSLWISLMQFWAIVHDKHLNCVYKMAHKSIAWTYK